MPNGHPHNRTSLVARLRRLLPVLMWVVLWGLPAAPRAVADPVPLERLEEVFPPVQKVAEGEEGAVAVFRAGELCCIALTDGNGGVQVIFMTPRRKPRNDGETARFHGRTRALHRYIAPLTGDPARVRLLPCTSSVAAAIVTAPGGRINAFPGCVPGMGTHAAVRAVFDMGGSFEKIENGEVTLLAPSKENPQERCAIVLSLFKAKVELLGFSPPPSRSKKEDAAVGSLLANLRIPRRKADADTDAETLRGVAKQLPGARCLAKGSSYAIIIFNKKLYVASPAALKRYVREHANGGSGDFLGRFSFPASGQAIPEPQQEPQQGEEPEPPQSQEPQPEPPEEPTTQEEEPAGDTPTPATPDSAPAATDSTPDPAPNKNEALDAYLRYLDGLRKP